MAGKSPPASASATRATRPTATATPSTSASTSSASTSTAFAIGFPVNSFTWQPTPRLTITASYIIPVTVDGRIRYELTDAVAVFGAFNNRFDAFRVDGQPDHHRTFLDQSLIEGGVAWSPNTQISLIAAVGYRLDGKFETGFDVRDTTTIADLSDEVFGRVEAVIVF